MTGIEKSDFARKVLIMRQAQQAFDQSGLWSDRKQQRIDEKKVDDLIARILDKQKQLDI